MAVMVTGAAGYIGSHAVQRLLGEGLAVLAVDNLVRGHRGAVAALMPMAQGRLSFEQTDIGDTARLLVLLREHQIDTVMHFAALAYVGESVDQPLRYYRANTAGALSLLEACDAAGVGRLVFSSTCATYGEPERVPLTEEQRQTPVSPYGASKLHVERMLRDYAQSCRRLGKPFAYAALRYFNVAGCDPQGLLGEDHDPETHLIPVLLRSALGLQGPVSIFGSDYDTPDGTCVRDYIHVCDLVDAHAAVMHALRPGDERFYNLGIGRGYSVRQVVEAARRVTGRPIRTVESPRRAGDPAALYADPSRIRQDLGWSARHTDLDEIVDTAWRWLSKHPQGYGSQGSGL
jgi:UDP-glucose-4-epimerase GalE